MFTKQFWKDAAERAVKTAAQAAVVVVGADVANVFELDWNEMAGLSIGAALLSVLTSIASEPFGEKGTASLVGGSE